MTYDIWARLRDREAEHCDRCNSGGEPGAPACVCWVRCGRGGCDAPAWTSKGVAR